MKAIILCHVEADRRMIMYVIPSLPYVDQSGRMRSRLSLSNDIDASVDRTEESRKVNHDD